MTTPSEAAPGAVPPQPPAAPPPAPEPEPDRAQAPEPAPAPAPAPVAILVPSVTVVQKVETVIDVKYCGGAGADADDAESEKVCRICHLSPDLSGVGGGAEGCELIQIGCGCRGGLGIAHRHCAEAWFRVKGNRYCPSFSLSLSRALRFGLSSHWVMETMVQDVKLGFVFSVE